MYLQLIQQLPPYLIYLAPPEALASNIKEFKMFSLPINHVNIKTKIILPGHLNIVEHDTARSVRDELLAAADQSLVIIDEIHKFQGETKRTAIGMDLIRNAPFFIGMSGTPIVCSALVRLLRILAFTLDAPLILANAWVGMCMMLNYITTAPAIEEDHSVEVVMSDANKERYLKLVPIVLGGSNAKASPEEMQVASDISFKYSTQEMINVAFQWLTESKTEGGLIVTKDLAHQAEIKVMLLAKDPAMKIICIDSKKAIDLTQGTFHGFVLAPIRKCHGWNGQILSRLFILPYRVNISLYIQARGRLNREGQTRKIIHCHMFHCGLLTITKRYKEGDFSLYTALAALSPLHRSIVI